MDPFDKLPKRVTDKIDFSGECWIWTAAKTNGYGVVWSSSENRVVRAHRLVWEALVGPIEPNKHMDHLCRVVACVNPKHLEPVEPKENFMRGISPWVARSKQTHCRKGHEYTEENTFRNKRNTRMCRECYTETSRRRREGSAGVCSEDGCEKFVNSRGLCSTHYERWRKQNKTRVLRDA
jgi:hypothetical protein